MASTSEIKNGLCIKWNHDIFKVIEFLHVKPGKGAAFVRTKMKSLTTGKVLDNTFPSGHKIDIVRVERKQYQFLYEDEMGFNFMDNETYDQVSINANLIDNARFLKEGMNVDVLYDADANQALTVELPSSFQYEVTYTEPGVKGDTATNSTKPATIDSGTEIRVPLFINQGDVVRIDTNTGDYLDRIKQ
jgi:elongation factor P